MAEKYPLAVYVPISTGILYQTIERGSGVVGKTDSEGNATIFFEGNLYGASNLMRYEERVMHAAGRLWNDYPTTAKMWVPKEAVARELIFVGTLQVDGKIEWLSDGTIEVTEYYAGEDVVPADDDSDCHIPM